MSELFLQLVVVWWLTLITFYLREGRVHCATTFDALMHILWLQLTFTHFIISMQADLNSLTGTYT